MTLYHYLVVSGLLFAVSLYGIFTRRNAVALLLAIELIMLAVALNFTACSRFLNDPAGQMFAVFVVAVAA
ncbi:NADH-quinone oxidoreductase subunit NuoK, partial [candidate division FCPU426 bacterium]|nr:NADH-quinone oxidoreductase subunit NuoK [candidate division FCPU426 bacterium]